MPEKFKVGDWAQGKTTNSLYKIIMVLGDHNKVKKLGYNRNTNLEMWAPRVYIKVRGLLAEILDLLDK